MENFPLKYGSTGKPVAMLQLVLNPILKKRGFQKIAVNGQFDSRTRAAVFLVFGTKQVSKYLYQSIFKRLKGSGIGVIDWNGYMPPAADKVTFPLKEWSNNKDAVVLVQLWINRMYREKGSSTKIDVDGVWGPGTTAAFKELTKGGKSVAKASYEAMLRNAKYTKKEDWNDSKYKAPKGQDNSPTPTNNNNTGADANNGGGSDYGTEAAPMNPMAVPLLAVAAAAFVVPSFLTDAYGQPDQRYKTLGTLVGLGAGGYGLYLLATSLIGGAGGGDGGGKITLSYPMSAYKVAADEIYNVLKEYAGIFLTDSQANEIKEKIVSFVKTPLDWQTLKTAYGSRKSNFYSFPETLPKMIKGALPQQTQFEINAHLSQFGAKL